MKYGDNKANRLTINLIMYTSKSKLIKEDLHSDHRTVIITRFSYQTIRFTIKLKAWNYISLNMCYFQIKSKNVIVEEMVIIEH